MRPNEQTAKRVGRPAVIDAELIVSTACEIGIPELSMSAVAQRLGVRTPSLYGHIAGIDDLRERVIVRLFDGFELPDVGDLDVRGVAFEVGRKLRRLLLDHPGLAELVLHSTPDPVYERYVETLGLYVDRGVDLEVAALIGEDLAGFVFSYDRVEIGARTMEGREPIVEWPARPGGAPVDGDQLFEWTLAAHLDGVMSRIERGDLPWS